MKQEERLSLDPGTNFRQTKVRRYVLVLSLGCVAFAGYVLLFGLWPRYFDIEWDEEVQLHDGRTIVVHVKRTYERRGMRLEQYPENPRQVSMNFSFDMGNRTIFEHTFMRGTLHFLDEKDGKWYIGYHADPGDPSVEIGTRLLYPHVAILTMNGSIVKPTSWRDVPAEITNANILPATPNPKVISKFNDKRLTVVEKMAHWNMYPTGAGWGKIQRISSQSTNKGGGK